MDMKKILQVLNESTMASAEKHEQGPEFTGYWKGKDKATPGKKMVGGESIIPALAKQARADTVKNKLVKEFEEFKEAQEEFVLYIDGKPASKYTDHRAAHKDLEFIRSKYPDKRAELKQEVCDLKTLPEGRLPDSYVKPVTATTPIQKTQVQPKQTVHTPKEPKATPAAVIDIKSKNELDEFAPPEPELEEGTPVNVASLLSRSDRAGRGAPWWAKATDPIYFGASKAGAPQFRLYFTKMFTGWPFYHHFKENTELAIKAAKELGFVEDEQGQLYFPIVTLNAATKAKINRAKYLFGDKTRRVKVEQPEDDETEVEEDSESNFNNTNPQDVIRVDVPLLIRLLEYAREDAKTDMDLHHVAERLIELSASGDVLSMDQYDAICGHAQESAALDEDSGSRDGIIGALTRRIMHRHQDALLKYGPERMLGAIQAEADAIGDVEELGSSDVSIAVDNVLNSLRLEDTVEDPLMKQPVPEEQLTELGADNPQMAQQGTTATPAGQDPDTAKEIAQTAKSLQTLKPVLQAAGAQNIDVNKVTQTLAKTDANPKAQPVGQDLTQISKLAPGVADIMKDAGAFQLFKQALLKATTAK